MEEEQKEYITCLFNNKKPYMIYAQEYKQKIFYKIAIEKQTTDGQTIKAYVPTRFAGCDPVENRTIIRLKNAKVDWYKNPKDMWNIVPALVIFDYEIIQGVSSTTQKAQNAVDQYNMDVQRNDDTDLPF